MNLQLAHNPCCDDDNKHNNDGRYGEEKIIHDEELTREVVDLRR